MLISFPSLKRKALGYLRQSPGVFKAFFSREMAYSDMVFVVIFHDEMRMKLSVDVTRADSLLALEL